MITIQKSKVNEFYSSEEKVFKLNVELVNKVWNEFISK